MTTPKTIRVRRADGAVVDLPAETEVQAAACSVSGWPMKLIDAYAASGRGKSWIVRHTDVMHAVTIELPIERAVRLERDLEEARSELCELRAACDVFPADLQALYVSTAAGAWHPSVNGAAERRAYLRGLIDAAHLDGFAFRTSIVDSVKGGENDR